MCTNITLLYLNEWVRLTYSFIQLSSILLIHSPNRKLFVYKEKTRSSQARIKLPIQLIRYITNSTRQICLNICNPISNYLGRKMAWLKTISVRWNKEGKRVIVVPPQFAVRSKNNYSEALRTHLKHPLVVISIT